MIKKSVENLVVVLAVAIVAVVISIDVIPAVIVRRADGIAVKIFCSFSLLFFCNGCSAYWYCHIRVFNVSHIDRQNLFPNIV